MSSTDPAGVLRGAATPLGPAMRPRPTSPQSAGHGSSPVVDAARTLLDQATPARVATIVTFLLLGLVALSGGSVVALVTRFLRGSWNP